MTYKHEKQNLHLYRRRFTTRKFWLTYTKGIRKSGNFQNFSR